jgi:hypothetical protein
LNFGWTEFFANLVTLSLCQNVAAFNNRDFSPTRRSIP